MKQPPAFQFYVDNFIEGTSDMSPHECGCYVRLLCHQWSRGQIPLSDPQKLRRVAGGVVSKEVLAKFPDGKNERLERERAKQQVWREKSREGGLKGAATRALRVVQPPLQPPLQPNGQPNGNIPSPSPSPDLCIDRYEQIEARLGVLFGRTEPSTVYSEQSAISEISRRPDAINELAEIEVFHRKPGNFFPQSLSKLLSAWQETLDRARTHDTRKKNHATDKQTGEKRIDRSIGTANEGISNQYKEFADRKAGRVATVVKT